MKTWVKISLALVVFCLLALAGLITLVNRMAPEVTERAQKKLKDSCATCDLNIEDITFSPRGLQASDVKFNAGRKGGQRVEVRAAAVRVKLEWLPLLRREVKIDRITVVQPDIIFFDGEARSRSKKAAGEDSSGVELQLNRILVEDGKFKYVRDVKDTHAELQIRKINATLTIKHANSEDLTEATKAEVAAKVTGQIGESGHVAINTTASIKKGPLYIDTDIVVENQNLQDLSKFFQPNAGVELHGILTEGKGRIEVRGNKATAKLKAEYKDFKLKLHKMYDRDGFQAFFMNLGTAIAMKEKNVDLPAEKKRETANVTREDGESIVSFMLRGLKEAAIDVTL